MTTTAIKEQAKASRQAAFNAYMRKTTKELLEGEPYLAAIVRDDSVVVVHNMVELPPAPNDLVWRDTAIGEVAIATGIVTYVWFDAGNEGGEIDGPHTAFLTNNGHWTCEEISLEAF